MIDEPPTNTEAARPEGPVGGEQGAVGGESRSESLTNTCKKDESQFSQFRSRLARFSHAETNESIGGAVGGAGVSPVMICISKDTSGKQCHHFQRGTCLYGDRCIHVHNVPASSLREVPSWRVREENYDNYGFTVGMDDEVEDDLADALVQAGRELRNQAGAPNSKYQIPARRQPETRPELGIIVGNLPNNITEGDLEKLYFRYGEVDSVKILARKKGKKGGVEAEVIFKTEDALTRALANPVPTKPKAWHKRK